MVFPFRLKITILATQIGHKNTKQIGNDHEKQ
jgi:hypothetical protein